jgi:hypothetical protein
MLEDGARWDAARRLIGAIHQVFRRAWPPCEPFKEVQEPRPTNAWAPLSIQTVKTSKNQVTRLFKRPLF